MFLRNENIRCMKNFCFSCSEHTIPMDRLEKGHNALHFTKWQHTRTTDDTWYIIIENMRCCWKDHRREYKVTQVQPRDIILINDGVLVEETSGCQSYHPNRCHGTAVWRHL
jgi:hypothetical protein